MGLGHLQGAAWAVYMVTAGGALANPLDDSDNDGVVDEVDVCPETPGVQHNFGCPADLDVVIATGRDIWNAWMVCPDNTGASHWTDCPGYSDGWGTFYVGWVSIPVNGVVVKREVYEDEDGDGVYDDDDLCDDEKGNETYFGCTAETYCLEIDDAFDLNCFRWTKGNLSLVELGSYYEKMRAFAEGGCNGDGEHWLCLPHYHYRQIAPDPWWDNIDLLDWITKIGTPPTCPDYYDPVDFSFWNNVGGSFYTGRCQNRCRTFLFSAGLLTTGAASIPQVATSVAGGRVLTAAGISLSGTALVDLCMGPMWVDGTYDD